MSAIIFLCFVLATLLGIAFHYAHRDRTKSLLVHILFPVNESTWEHLKLVYQPMMIMGVLQCLLLSNDYLNIVEGNFMGIIVAMLLIPLLYYPVKILVKKEIMWFSISVFVLSILIGYLTVWVYLKFGISNFSEELSAYLLILLFLAFGVFTFYPPRIFLFLDPVKKQYGHRIK